MQDERVIDKMFTTWFNKLLQNRRSNMNYKIVRFCFDDNHPDHNRVIKTGLTEEEAQEHCQREDTHEPGVWFDGYTEE